MIRDAIARLAAEDGELSAHDRLRPFIGVVDTGGHQLSQDTGRRMILESEHSPGSQEFLELAGSAPDFPYPDEPPEAEPGPDLD